MNLKKESGLFSVEKREMKNIKGGNYCGCACQYAGTPGGSSSSDNLNANFDGNLYSDTDGPQRWVGTYPAQPPAFPGTTPVNP